MRAPKKNPAAAATADGVRQSSLRREPSRNTPNQGRKPSLTVRVWPGGQRVHVEGREAQTLTLLLTTGARGFTSGEASPLGWARRTSAYIFKLRRRGLPIATAREATSDGARVARYTLAGPVVTVTEGGAT
jgi:hypothetical protein